VPDIAHRNSVAAPPAHVRQLVATTNGIEAWWTGSPVAGDTSLGARLGVRFGDATEPAAVFEVENDEPGRIAWRCVSGPAEWLGTGISFTFNPGPDGGTTLLFGHTGWSAPTEFFAGCSTNWGAYLISLKSGAEGLGFAAYPEGEISRWN